MTFATADLFDDRGDELQSCWLQLRDLGGVRAFTGLVETVLCLEDNALVKDVLAGPGEDRVLVVDGHGSLRSALMGDRIAAAAVEHGWAGVVINGAVRDSAALAPLPLGVKALGTNPRRSAKAGTGQRGIPVSFGGVTFRPGARLWADADGILVER